MTYSRAGKKTVKVHVGGFLITIAACGEPRRHSFHGNILTMTRKWLVCRVQGLNMEGEINKVTGISNMQSTTSMHLTP